MHLIRTRLWRASIVAICAGSIAALAAQYPGWLIPPGGKDEKSPMASVADAATRGKAVFVLNCARCHGQDGKGHAVLEAGAPIHGRFVGFTVIRAGLPATD